MGDEWYDVTVRWAHFLNTLDETHHGLMAIFAVYPPQTYPAVRLVCLTPGLWGLVGKLWWRRVGNWICQGCQRRRARAAANAHGAGPEGSGEPPRHGPQRTRCAPPAALPHARCRMACDGATTRLKS